MAKVHYMEIKDYERTLCGRDIWDCSVSINWKNVTCKECIKNK